MSYSAATCQRRCSCYLLAPDFFPALLAFSFGWDLTHTLLRSSAIVGVPEMCERTVLVLTFFGESIVSLIFSAISFFKYIRQQNATPCYEYKCHPWQWISTAIPAIRMLRHIRRLTTITSSSKLCWASCSRNTCQIDHRHYRNTVYL